MNNFSKNYFVIITLFLIFLVFHRKFNGSSESDSSYMSDGLNRIDFSDMLTTKDVYDSIKCRQSIKIIVQTTICVHDLTDDQHVSGAIWNHGIWEGHIMQRYMDLISNNPDWLIFDIGAQVGQYSLFSAKLGRDVVAVEPFFDNVLRINKAVRTEGYGHRITLIRNAVSNKKNEIKRLFPYKGDLGGQTLLNHKKEIYSREDMKKDKYLVETILFDDLIAFLPNQPNGSPYKKGILKIDIEGFEPYAFDSAHKLFNLIDFQVIFMEWVHLPRHADLADLVEKMIDLFNKHKLVAYDGGNKLDGKNWRQWPQDVVWLKDQ